MELKIYDKQGLVKMTVSPDNSSQWNHEVGVENVVTVNFTTWEFLVLEVGWYILVEGQRFSIKSEYRPKHIHDTKYTYNLKFYGREHDAQDILFCRLNQGKDDLESVFSYDGTPMDFLQKVVANMNRNTDGVVWKAGEAISANRQTINFNGLYCWDALGEIARAFGTEWWMDGEYLNISKCERGESVSLGYGQGLKSGLTQNENTNAVKWFTRLIPVGSSKNIDKNKYGYATLQLPGREKYIDINTQYGLKEYREEAAFSEIYPHRVGTISSVRSEERTNEETGNYTVYYVKDSSLPFNPDEYMIGGEVIHMTFNSGALAGKDFEVNWNNETKEFEIINQYPDENTQLPGGNLVPSADDTYVLWNISMPDEYIRAAEQELKTAVDVYLAEYSKDISVYSGSTDYIYISKNDVPLLLGQRVRLLSEIYFGNIGRDSRITRVSRKLNNLNEATIDCSDAIASSWKSSVDSSLNKLLFSYAKDVTNTIFSILKTGDSESPSEYNVFSSKRSLNTFLSKLQDDIAKGLITFMRGLISKGTTETDDVIVNEAIHSKEFISGFTGGKGWAIRLKEYLNSAGVIENRSELEIDDIVVRGALKVFEFVVSQLLGENDNRIFTAMLEVDHYDKETGMVWLDTQGGKLYNPFRVDDIILVQQYNGMPSEENDYYITKQYELVVSEIGVGDLSLGEDRLDWVKFRNFSSPMEGATEELITKGDTFVRIDNLSNPDRKGIIEMMTVGADTPYMDVVYGKKTDPDNALKARFGNLQGIYSPLFGWLKDFGAYITNLYAVGEFRIAHTGEDVADSIEMVKGAFRTNFKQVMYDVTEGNNLFTNGVFAGDLSMWQLGETDMDFLTVGGNPVFANRNILSATNSFCGVDEYMGRSMMRVFDSKVTQTNGYITRPDTHKEYEEGEDGEVIEKEVLDKVYLTLVYYCRKDGDLWIGFTDDYGNPHTTESTTLPNTSVKVEAGVNEKRLTCEGVWDGTGNFTISTTGDIYVDMVVLTTKPLEDFKAEYSTRIEQDARRIALIAEKTTETESKVAQLEITADGLSSTVATAQGSAEEAKRLADAAEEAANDAYSRANSAYRLANSAYDNAATAIQQSAQAISMVAANFNEDGSLKNTSGLVIASDFTNLSTRVGNVEASISTFVTHDELGQVISKIQLTADNIDFNNGVMVINKTTAQIGKFSIDANGLYTTATNAYIKFDFSGTKFIRINNSADPALFYGRNDDGTIINLNSYGSGICVDLLCNHASGYALKTQGRVLLESLDTNRSIRIHGGCTFTNSFDIRYSASSTYKATFSLDYSNRLMMYSNYWAKEESVSNGYMYVDGSGYMKVKGATRV